MRNIYRETFDQIHASEQLREEVMEMSKQERTTTANSRVPKATFIAAVLVLALAGTALAVVSPTLRGWFEQKWAEETGGQLTESQSLLINSLTQKVGESVTSGEVTVTVDSITVGGSQIWALLDVEGWDFDRDAQYSFDRVRAEIVPDPSDGQHGGAGYGLDSIGFTEEGAARMLLEFSATISTGNQLNSGDYALVIGLNDLIRCHSGGVEDEILYEGEWSFSIPLTVECLSPVITIDSVFLPDMEEPEILHDTDGEVEYAGMQKKDITLRDIQITSTGLSFVVDSSATLNVEAILSDGTEVLSSTGVGTTLEDGSMYCTHQWPVLLDVEDIVALRIGGTEIPVPQASE